MTQSLGVPGKRHHDLWLGIETYERRFAHSIAKKKIDQRSQAIDLVKLQLCHASLLDCHDHRNRFVIQIVVDMKLLLHAVVQQFEVAGPQAIKDFPRWHLYQGWDQHFRALHTNRGLGRGCLQAMSRKSQQEDDRQEQTKGRTRQGWRLQELCRLRVRKFFVQLRKRIS